MPKKKLTKAQVRRKFRNLNRDMYDLTNDKLGHGSASFVPMSINKLLELYKAVDNASMRIKWMEPGKNIVINANETVQDMSGKSLEQWLLRVCVMYLLFGEKAMGMI